MQMSEEGKARLMVIPVVAMLAVTMMVAGWQQGGDDEVEIDVAPGHGELIIPEEKIPEKGEVENYPQNKSIVTTYVNNESSLELEVEPMYVTSPADEHNVRFKFRATGEFDEDLDIENLKFVATPSDGIFTFEGGFANISGGTLIKQEWPPESFVYVLDSNEFTAEVTYSWTIHREKEGDSFSLEVEAIVGGLSEEVSASIDVHFERGDKA